MSTLALNLTQWTAISAIGTLVLAIATMAVVFVTVLTARADRKRDDAKRQQDRDWDTARRKEDRDRDEELRREQQARDDQLRREDMERNDRLRREDREELERRYRAEQRDREDNDARQVTVEVEPGKPPFDSVGHDFSHRITISAPASYPIKQPVVQIAYQTNNGIGIRPTGHGGDQPVTEQGRTYVRVWAEIPDQLFRPAPIVRFVDPHGNLYYSYRQQTWRFPQNTEWLTAARQIDEWIRTGPKPDEP